MAIIARGQITIRVASDTYTIYQSIDKMAVSCDYTGKVLSSLALNSVISIRCGEIPVTDFSIGAITKPSGFYSITVNQATKTIAYSIMGDDTTLADTGAVSIPIIINGETYAASFNWFKVKAGKPGNNGVDASRLDWVSDWNSGKTVIDSQSVITPKIFAGTKNTNGTITGTAIGKFSLSTKNASGVISSEVVNGIYGFSEGKKTFEINATGDVQLGNGNEFIKYNASTGKVEFGSSVALAWVGATYINANGIFTGTLSATTIHAINIDASQITAGIINASRIDVNSLKASLITAGNIEALTLNVTKGKIGGWSLDADSIFRGTKNNTTGGFTAASGSITIGSNGIRSLKWRFESTGAGAIAGSNVVWDSAGNITFSESVTLQWAAPIAKINTALGGDSFPKLTQISSTGIYTGSLNANQITAGTINAARLNVDALKATLITAGNIEALTLNVTKGVIGGWTINSSSISGGQIVMDKANNRIAVYGASSSPTSGNRVQLYHNSNTDFGLFATDTAGNTVVQLGHVNRIAGWTINGTQIYKNSVYLGADGSIVNGTKWKLNNNGSGQVANGNIAWDTVGNVTFGSSVSLQWKSDIANAQKANFGYPYYQSIVINGDANTYYPVIIKGGDQNFKRDIVVRRSYSEQAPDTWNTSTHKGGLVLHLKTNFGGWGGISYSWDIYELSESYCRMFAGALHCGNSCMFAIFLRGGGTVGAKYHIYSDLPIANSDYSPSPIPPSPQIAYNSEQIFQIGSTIANAPAPRTLTQAVEEEIRRHRFIGLAQGNDTTLKEHPLTYIGSTGIYTGTLTANQINAGTISADRIAAGSITASKLDAASIKANIINTDYINGLSCTFVRGKIGGFNIGSDNMTVGSLGTVGQTPIQIRTASSGSGYWYTGLYKPFGISMLWCQNNNAGHIVIGQIATSGNTVKTGFMGIQMMAWDNTEYFCLSTNYSRSGSKEIYNRIAGWAFDNANIWKNSVYLGSDGSIYNSTKWRLNNDGSGRVANGNIVWDAAGNVTFGSSVSLNWTNAANNALNTAKSYADTKKTEAINAAATDATNKSNAAKELAQAMAFGKMLFRDPTFYNGQNSTNIYNNSGNGTVSITRTSDSNAPNDSKYVLKIINAGSASPGCGGFYFGNICSYRKVFITRIIAKIPVGRTIQWATNAIGTGGSSKWLTSNAGTGDWAEYVYKVTSGTSNFSSTNFFYIEGTATLTWYVAYATVFDITSSEKYTTTIDGNGIYTSTLNANQINAGTISADRIAAGSINASKLDAASIKANIINTSYINGLSCTFNKGTIGGWNINASQIYKNSVVLSSDGSITNGIKWKLNTDGSGQLASGNISWDTVGNVAMTGAINASSGSIGGFTIAYGRIGSTATGSGSGGGLAIYEDLFRVGSSVSYVMFGNNTFPASAGGTSATGRIVNTKYNSYNTNYGLYIDVRNAEKNIGIYSNAACMAPGFVGTRINNVYFSGSSYSIDFSKGNIFFIYASQNYGVNLPTSSSVAYMFGYSSLPSDFGYVFTLVYNYNWGNRLTINNVRDQNGNLTNIAMERGDVLTLLCSNYPSFHYQKLQHQS